MIKKILIGIVFLVLIAIGVMDIVFVDKSVNFAIERTNELEKLIDSGAEGEKLKETANELEQNWIKSEKMLTVFMYYRDVDTLGKQINLVKMLIEENSLEDAKVEIGGLKYLLSSAKKISEFSFDNIF